MSVVSVKTFREATVLVEDPATGVVYDCPRGAVAGLAGQGEMGPVAPPLPPVLTLCGAHGRPGGCGLGAACGRAHVKVPLALLAPTRAHVHFGWRSTAAVTYPLLSAEAPEVPPTLTVLGANRKGSPQDIPAGLLLKTRGALETLKHVLRRHHRKGQAASHTSHCAHYYYNCVCVRGEDCAFAHVVSLMEDTVPNALPPDVARALVAACADPRTVRVVMPPFSGHSRSRRPMRALDGPPRTGLRPGTALPPPPLHIHVPLPHALQTMSKIQNSVAYGRALPAALSSAVGGPCTAAFMTQAAITAAGVVVVSSGIAAVRGPTIADTGAFETDSSFALLMPRVTEEVLAEGTTVTTTDVWSVCGGAGSVTDDAETPSDVSFIVGKYDSRCDDEVSSPGFDHIHHGSHAANEYHDKNNNCTYSHYDPIRRPVGAVGSVLPTVGGCHGAFLDAVNGGTFSAAGDTFMHGTTGILEAAKPSADTDIIDPTTTTITNTHVHRRRHRHTRPCLADTEIDTTAVASSAKSGWYRHDPYA